MDKQKIDILKRIQKLRDENICVEFEILEKEGFRRGLLKEMIKENLINYQGCFSLTENGDKILRDYLILNSYKKEVKQKIMFDNDILNKIVEGELEINSILKNERFEFYATTIQTDQFSSCKDDKKRKQLSYIFSKLRPLIIPTESGVWGVSRWGESKWSDGKDLEKLRQGNSNHNEDALVGETAIKNKIILVTNDKLLKKRVNSNNGNAINLREFKEMLK